MAASMPTEEPWTVAYRRWLTTLRFEHPAQQITLQDYIHAVQSAEQRVARKRPTTNERKPGRSSPRARPIPGFSSSYPSSLASIGYLG